MYFVSFAEAVVTLAYMAEETFLMAKRWRQLTYYEKPQLKDKCKATLDTLVDEKDTTSFNRRFVGGFCAWDVEAAHRLLL
ncbi:unnamed protein product [Cuscuta campestris]|uniref:Uncharacterized protein n=1 Tax=Cuscuta campestris TaxID=132261 RepID=A0A484N6T6_9ASTE|nr:unnamed protein product [Cuscuta campestris]